MNYRNLLSSCTLAVSIIIHLALFLLVGGMVLIQGIAPKQPFTAVDDSTNLANLPPPPELPPDNESPAPRDPSAPNDESSPAAASSNPFDINTIVAQTPSQTYNVVAQIGVFTPGVSDNGPGGGGGGESTKVGNAVTAGMRKITMFSSNFEVRKMGVIMDVSGSAASFILPMLLEIDKNFATDVTIVLYQGCGLAPNGAKNATIAKLRQEKNNTTVYQALFGRVLARLYPDNNDLKTFINNLCRRDNVWCVYSKNTTATQLAFDQLFKENVDTIYWFADFGDPLDADMVQKLTATMKEKKVKIIFHNFSGGRFVNDKNSQREQLQIMADQTGGTTIRVKPTPIK